MVFRALDSRGLDFFSLFFFFSKFLVVPAMARNVNQRTLFHLVAVNDAARDALLRPDNKHFVSNLGLKFGFRVPSTSRGRVITRLGRDGDLILSGRSVSSGTPHSRFTLPLYSSYSPFDRSVRPPSKLR